MNICHVNKISKSRFFALMLVLIIIILSACSRNTTKPVDSTATIKETEVPRGSPAKTRTFTDTVGRTITVPSDIKKVYSLSPVGSIMMYTIAPDKIAGLNSSVFEDDKKFLLPDYCSLPVLSGNFGMNNKMNTEEILQVKPDVIINMGNVDHTSVEESQKIQDKLKIPVAYIGFDIKTMGKAYEKLGELVGESERGKELGKYCTETIDGISKKAAAIPEGKRVRVYYAEGEKGLQTDPEGSPHTEVLALVGGKNVADVKIKNGYGRSDVSMEQLLSWNPDRIIVCVDAGTLNEKNPFNFIMSDSAMKQLEAVKNKKVNKVPYHPFNWIDRPPAANRIIGVKWLANLLYPDVFKLDIKKETKEFYDKFYHKKLTDEEVDEVLSNAL